MGLTDYVVSLTVIGLFVIAILGFAINFANDNNSPINIANNPNATYLNYSTTSKLTTFSEEAEDTYNSTTSSTISGAAQTVTNAGVFTLTVFSIITTLTNILSFGYKEIFGTNTGFGIFLTTFLGLMVFIAAMAVWKAWAGRNPD